MLSRGLGRLMKGAGVRVRWTGLQSKLAFEPPKFYSSVTQSFSVNKSEYSGARLTPKTCCELDSILRTQNRFNCCNLSLVFIQDIFSPQSSSAKCSKQCRSCDTSIVFT